MSRFPRLMTEYKAQLVHVACFLAVFLLAVLLYEPKSLCELMHSGEGRVAVRNIYPFNIAIFCAMIPFVMLLCRSLFYLFRNNMDMTVPWYVLWCFGEMVVLSALVSIYTSLISGEGYFSCLTQAFSSLALIFVFPYIILTLAYSLNDARNGEIAPGDERIRFYDSRHLLKLVTLKSSILYIEASENYMRIHYTEHDELKVYDLRNSMKNVELISASAGFVRSHRSFIVNPSHVKSIVKGDEGHYFATIDSAPGIRIPVSKKYHDNMVTLL